MPVKFATVSELIDYDADCAAPLIARFLYPIAAVRARVLRIDSGNSIASGGVVSSPTLSLITRKFARQSHAAIHAYRNAAFYRL